MTDMGSEGARKGRHKRFVPVVAVLGTPFLVAGIIWGPWILERHHLYDSNGNLVDSAGLIVTGLRTALIAIVAGAIAGAGLWYTHQKHQLEQTQFDLAQEQFKESQKQFAATLNDTQKRAEREAELTREAQVAGRYVEAIKLIASTELHERLGGIYSLERIMNDSERDRATVVEVLAAFICARLTGDSEVVTKESQPGEPALPTRELDRDVRAAANALGRNWNETYPRADLRSLNPRGVDMREINLSGANLSGATLEGSNLERATLSDAQLIGAHLDGATLHRANLDGADLSGARLQRAQLQWASLREATCHGANFHKANLGKSSLREASFVEAKLVETVLHGADLREVDLNWSSLVGALGLHANQIAAAKIYSSTVLPPEMAEHPRVRSRIAICDSAWARGRDPEPETSDVWPVG